MLMIRTKFLIAFSVMVGLIAALSIIADYSMDQVYLGVSVVKEEYGELALLYDLQNLLHNEVTAATNYLVSQNPDKHKMYQSAHRLFKDKFEQFNRISGKVQDERDDRGHEKKEKILIATINNEYLSMERIIEKIFSLPDPANNPAALTLSNDLSRSFAAFNRNIRAFRDEDQQELKKAIKSASRAENKADDILWLSSLFALVVGLAFSIFFSRSILKPILDLCRGVALISKGNFDTHVNIERSDEIGILAEGYNTMAQQLKESYAILANKVKERTAELEESNRNLLNLFNGITDGIFVIDSNFKIVNANKAAADLFVTDSRDLIGTYCYQMFDKDDSVCKNCPVRETFQTGRTTSAFKEWKRANGEKFFSDINAFPLANKNGSVTHVIEHMRDITEKKQLQEKLLRSEKLSAIGQLAAGVAHEINNPLASIAGCAEGLLSRIQQPGFPTEEDRNDFPDYLETIDEEVYHCKSITSQLLDFSRQIQPRFSTVEINQLIIDTLESVKKQTGLEKIQFVTLLSAQPLCISADASQLRQVFYNVAKNAVDSIEADGKVLITTKGNDGSVEIVFQDSGCGLSPDSLSKVFNPFFTTKPLGQGTGLGLSLCYGIIEQHGGQIQIASEGVGMGATLTIILPIQQS